MRVGAADSVAGRRPGRASGKLHDEAAAPTVEDLQWRPAPDRRLDLGLPASAPTRYPAIRSDRPIFEQFQAMAMVRGEAAAVDDGEQALSYIALMQGALRLSAAVAAANPHRAAIGIAVKTAAWLPLAILAALRAGAPFVAVDTRDPLERQRRILASAGVAVLLTDDPAEQRTAASCARLDIAALLAGAATEAPGPAPAGVDDPAFILYTSGTTGEPKGLANSQRAILQRAAQYVAACHVAHDDAFMPLGGLATIAGYREMFAALLSGATLLLARPERAGVRGLREIIAQRRPTMIYIVPSLLRVVLSGAAAEDVASVRVLRVGGEEILWSDIELARRVLPPAGRVQIG